MEIPGAVVAAICGQAREAGAEECCGLLLGTATAIRQAVPTANVAADRTRRYEIEAAAYFAAIRQARSVGLEVVGAYHSHPRSAPVPSPTDRAEAFENFLFLIVGPSDQIRAWRLAAGNFVEVALVPLP